jgi:hypothetical protein
MSYLDSLTTARDNFASKLAEISVSPQASYSIDGQSVSYTDYYRFLSEQVKSLSEQIANGQPFDIEQRVT